MTLITCLAMRALLDADQPLSSNPIRNGVQWLLEAQNPDGGWGNLTVDNNSDAMITAYALRVLTRTAAVQSSVEVAIGRGQTWLMDTQNLDHSWGRAPGERGSLPYVSHAVEGLLVCGVHPSSLLSVRNWILANAHLGNQFADVYRLELPNGVTRREYWTHFTDERSLIALLRLGADIAATEVNLLVRRILDRQVDGKYWRSDSLPHMAPAWAMVEAVLALRLYCDRLEREEPIIVSRKTVSELKTIIKEHSERIANLESQMAQMTTASLKAKLMQWLGLRGGERQAQE